jgi:RND family efflux transporter MFP subunit
MKAIKKYSTVVVVLLVIILVIFRLFNNKSKLDNDLRAMTEYSSVIPVEVISPEIRDTESLLTENGMVKSGGEVTILSETSGKVLSANIKPGDRVSAGQILIKVEKDVIKSQFNLAELNLQNAERDYDRYSKLAGGEAITQQQLENAKLALYNARSNYTALKKQLENTDIKSPVNGMIVDRFVEEGDNILPSFKVCSIIEKSKMIFVVKLQESLLQSIKRGDRVSVNLDALEGKSLKGNIRSIGIVPDMSGRYEVEIAIQAADERIRDGLNGKATFTLPAIKGGMTIPRKCIAGSINDAKIFILQSDSVISRKIAVQALNDREVIVTNGLSGSEKVILTGQINLTDGTKVKVLNR